MKANARIRLKLLSYLHAARPAGQDVPTLTEGLRLDGFRASTEDSVKAELELMRADGLAGSQLDKFSKDRLLWSITDSGIEAALEHGV